MQLAATSAIVARGELAAQRELLAGRKRRIRVVVPAPARAAAPRPSSDPSLERRGAGALEPCTRGSFGARLRRRLPQYGHSVMYGLTSDPHCLHTTKRSAPEDIVDPF
jgi:hypothetical protein